MALNDRVRRLANELRRAPASAAAEAVLEALRARPDGDALLVGAFEGRRLRALGGGEAERIALAPTTYAAMPTREGRVRLLRLLADVARSVVRIHVVVGAANTHLGRTLVDAPRVLLRRLGLPLAEPGDRFGAAGYAHAFFDEEALLEEIAEAGLTLAARRGFTFDLARADDAVRIAEDADPFASELARALRLVRAADAARRGSPAAALRAMRARGRDAARVRGPIGRARLRRAIGWVDASLGASCYRRILLESALDAGAATETVVFGLDIGTTGHVAFEGLEDRTFDVAFAIPRDPA